MGEWVPAGKLRIGDAIRKADGRYGLVQASVFVYQPQPMYNLTVAEAHTYFVGDGQWLVHNVVCPNFFSGFKNGTGFSAAFDSRKGSIFAKPSSYDLTAHSGVHVIDGVEWVPGNGGHMQVANDAITAGSIKSDLWGFAMVYEGPKSLNIISWHSLGLNTQHSVPNADVPTDVQQKILDALRDQFKGWSITANTK